MDCGKIHLKEHYSFIGQNGADPVLEYFRPYNMSEMHWENKKRPCVVICPGGGYELCSQREAEPIALKFTDMGFNAFILWYSVAPHRFPTQLLEVAAVFDMINKNADTYNCDNKKIAILGFSAGGHLAAHYSTDFDCDEIKSHLNTTYRPFAQILCYPVISTDESISNKGSFENLLGYYPSQEEQPLFSCEKRVKENTPQAFIWHTAADTTVPVQNSIKYAEALAQNSIPFELHIYPFGSHGLSTADDQTCTVVDRNKTHVAAWTDALKKWVKLIF